jgi:peptidoglycan/xylan/chitin deacetylase (PgdA/CDA1 family)
MRLFRPCLPARLLYPDALFRIKTAEKVLWLTFDDGPDPVSTPLILKILGNHALRGLFFCNGSLAEKYPDLIEQIKSKGHLIGNHGYSHLNGWKTSVSEYLKDVERSSAHTSSLLFRPPYGRLKMPQFLRLRQKYKIIFWDIMPYDFDKSFSSEKSLKILKEKIRPGSIIVLHDNSQSTATCFLDEFIKYSINEGYLFKLPLLNKESH